VHEFFSDQFYTLEHGLSPADQRTHDRRTGELFRALGNVWRQPTRYRAGARRSSSGHGHVFAASSPTTSSR
jgi:hypothetical protein